MSLSSLDNYQKGTRAWFADAVDGWISATLSERQARPSTARGQGSSPRAQVTADHVKLVFSDEKGRVCFSYRRYTTHTDSHVQTQTFESKLSDVQESPTGASFSTNALPPLRNPPLLEQTEDLTNLSYLNEPSGRQTASCYCSLLRPSTQSCTRYGHGMSSNRSTPTLASSWSPSTPSVQWVPPSGPLLE
jgi:hypothetical protein